jgi:putative transposase
MVPEGFDQGRVRESAAAARVAGMLSAESIDALLSDAKESGMALDGRDGLLGQMMKAVLERALAAEMTGHLGYEHGVRTAGTSGVDNGNGRASAQGGSAGNVRNGSYPKTVTTSAGPVTVDVPRDRAGEFEPVIVPKGRRRLGGVDEMILSLYARGMSTRDISSHLWEVYGAQASPALISRVTDTVAEEVTSWRNRPLDEVYPILYIDAIRIKVRDGGSVVNKAAHLVIGVDVDGVKNVLGMWIEENEGAKFWLHVLTQLKQRGVRDALIVCCDGLKGLPEAIEAVWPDAITQTCVVHLIRAANRYVSYTDRKKVSAALKPLYTAVDESAALQVLEELRDAWGRQYPGMIAVFENAWDRFIPFLDFDQDIRRVIYTTNAIESINRNLRKLVKTSGHFPHDDAAAKMLYLGIRQIEGRHIDGDGHVPAGRTRGTGTLGWHRAMNQFKIRFGDRLPL